MEAKGGTVTITSVSWATGSVLVEEAETPIAAIGDLTYLIGSGGVDNTDYDTDVVCTITFTFTHGALTAEGLTQDATLPIRIENA